MFPTSSWFILPFFFFFFFFFLSTLVCKFRFRLLARGYEMRRTPPQSFRGYTFSHKMGKHGVFAGGLRGEVQKVHFLVQESYTPGIIILSDSREKSNFFIFTLRQQKSDIHFGCNHLISFLNIFLFSGTGSIDHRKRECQVFIKKRRSGNLQCTQRSLSQENIFKKKQI